MSAAFLIAVSFAAPEDLEANRLAHQQVMDDLAAEAGRLGWPGVDFDHYARANGAVLIQVVPGDSAPTLEGLRVFRERQKAERAERRGL